jgi:hypothetical protein
MNDTPLDLGALEELEKAATPGPWAHHSRGDEQMVYEKGHRVAAVQSWQDPQADAALIAALRNAAPQLLAAARELLELRQQLATIHASGRCGADVMTPERIAAWAREVSCG